MKTNITNQPTKNQPTNQPTNTKLTMSSSKQWPKQPMTNSKVRNNKSFLDSLMDTWVSESESNSSSDELISERKKKKVFKKRQHRKSQRSSEPKKTKKGRKLNVKLQLQINQLNNRNILL